MPHWQGWDNPEYLGRGGPRVRQRPLMGQGAAEQRSGRLWRTLSQGCLRTATAAGERGLAGRTS